MTIHTTGVETYKTGCGKFDADNYERQVRGLDRIKPNIKTDDWTEVDCKACLQLYVYPIVGRLPNGKHSNRGFTDRITRDWYPNSR